MVKNKDNANEEKLETKFPKKWEKRLPPEIDDSKAKIDAMSEEDIKKMLVKWQQAISNTENDLDNCPELLSLKEQVKEKSEPYKTTINQCLASMRYAGFVLESRGR